MKRSIAAISVVDLSIAAIASDCFITESRKDENGNPIKACDKVTPADPPLFNCGYSPQLNQVLTDAVGGNPSGNLSSVNDTKYCSWRWDVDTTGDFHCDAYYTTIASMGSTRAGGGACPEPGPGGIQ
jgi:hypothetical protein